MSHSDLAIRTNNKERVRITAEGNVGIGTCDPEGILHVDGGQAPPATNGTNIRINAQQGGAADATGKGGIGGDIILRPGRSFGYTETTMSVENPNHPGTRLDGTPEPEFIDQTVKVPNPGGRVIIEGTLVPGEGSVQSVGAPDMPYHNVYLSSNIHYQNDGLYFMHDFPYGDGFFEVTTGVMTWDGKFGIGYFPPNTSTVPTAQLHVVGDALITTDAEVKGNLDAGSITTGSLGTDSITTGSLDAGSGNIQTTGNLDTGTITTGSLGAGNITATSLNAGSGNITTTGSLGAGSIMATSINAGSGTIQTTGGITTGSLDAGTGSITAGSLDAGTGLIETTGDVNATNVLATGYIKSTAGHIIATAGNIESTAGSVSAATTVSAPTVNTTDVNTTDVTALGVVSAGSVTTPSLGAGSVTATTGDITATLGHIKATAGNIIATAGNIESTAGGVSAATTVSAPTVNTTDVNTTDVTALGVVSAGSVTTPSLGAGSVTATTGDMTATLGHIKATAGNIIATAGNIEATAGGVSAATTVSAPTVNTTDVNTTDVTALGVVSAGSVTTPALTAPTINADNVTATANVGAATVTVTGVVTAGSVTTGSVTTAGNVDAGSVTTPALTVPNLGVFISDSSENAILAVSDMVTDQTFTLPAEGGTFAMASGVAANLASIQSNDTDIATNASNITSNDGATATNTSGVAANLASIGTNDTDIANNLASIQSNDTDIATNASNITSNDGATATNTSGVAANVTDIATNATDIGTNDTDIATNVTNIGNNDTDIATNATNIGTNDGDILALQAAPSGGITAPQITGWDGNAPAIAQEIIDRKADVNQEKADRIAAIGAIELITGPQGTQGIQGLPGVAGNDGADGIQGFQGFQGPAGADGTNGLDGATGPAGTDGTNGLDGATGPSGADGTNGLDGAVGADGPEGPAGPIAGINKQVIYNSGGNPAGGSLIYNDTDNSFGLLDNAPTPRLRVNIESLATGPISDQGAWIDVSNVSGIDVAYMGTDDEDGSGSVGVGDGSTLNNEGITRAGLSGNGGVFVWKKDGSYDPLVAISDNNGSGFLGLYDGASSTSTINFDGATGTTTTKVLEITGGADLSEQFDIRKPVNIDGYFLQEEFSIKPGMVVGIDPENPGKLLISSEAYNRKVVGIISGAGGVQTGMMMGQKGSIADGQYPVALTGRVYCYVDATEHPVRAGDLLTTSGTPGHAMKVTEYAEAHGAILGKAMTSLDKGKGLVLVLVTLQ